MGGGLEKSEEGMFFSNMGYICFHWIWLNQFRSYAHSVIGWSHQENVLHWLALTNQDLCSERDLGKRWVTWLDKRWVGSWAELGFFRRKKVWRVANGQECPTQAHFYHFSFPVMPLAFRNFDNSFTIWQHKDCKESCAPELESWVCCLLIVWLQTSEVGHLSEVRQLEDN